MLQAPAGLTTWGYCDNLKFIQKARMKKVHPGKLYREVPRADSRLLPPQAERERVDTDGKWLRSSAPNRRDTGGKAATGAACYSGKVLKGQETVSDVPAKALFVRTG